MSARQVRLVSGHSVYAMDDDSRFSKLATKNLQMSNKSQLTPRDPRDAIT